MNKGKYSALTLRSTLITHISIYCYYGNVRVCRAECVLLSVYPIFTEFDSSRSHRIKKCACAVTLSHCIIHSNFTYNGKPVHQRNLCWTYDHTTLFTVELSVRFFWLDRDLCHFWSHCPVRIQQRREI